MRLCIFAYVVTDLVSVNQALQLLRAGGPGWEFVRLAWWLSGRGEVRRELRSLGDMDQALVEAVRRYRESAAQVQPQARRPDYSYLQPSVPPRS